VSDNLNPEWNHTAEIGEFAAVDTLEFTVLDKDPVGNPDDLLGRARLDKEKILPAGYEGELRLRESSKTAQAVEAYLRVKVEVVRSFLPASKARSPAAEADAKRAEEKGRRTTKAPAAKAAEAGQPLKVVIVGARGVREPDWKPGTGKDDAYCTCEIPAKPGSKFQTGINRDAANPVWDHSAEVQGYAPGDALQFAVRDKEHQLGTAVLQGDQVMPSGFEGELPLSDTGKGVKAFLEVKVSVLEDEAAKKKAADEAKKKKKKADDAKKKKAEEAKKAAEAKKADEAKKAEDGKKAEDTKKVEGTKKAEDAKKAEAKDAQRERERAFKKKPKKEQEELGAKLRAAAKAGHAAEVQQLLESGVGVNAEDGDGWTALLQAAQAGEKGTVEVLLNSGANAKAAVKLGEWGNTPLHLAARGGHRDVAELLAQRSDLKAKNYKGKTPTEIAKEEGHKDMAKWLQGLAKASGSAA